jgi:hypothetical protein
MWNRQRDLPDNTFESGLTNVGIIVSAAVQKRCVQMSTDEMATIADLVAEQMEPHEMFHLATQELDARNDHVAKAIILAFLHVDATQAMRSMPQRTEGVS